MEPVSIIVPVFNEAEAVPKTLEAFRAVLPRLHPESEIIFVNDGSTDETSQRLADLPDSRMCCLGHVRNRGYGAALKTGIGQARHAIVAITDADGSYPLDMLAPLLEGLLDRKSDMVVGSRTGKKAKTGLFRPLPKFLLRKLAEYLSERKIPDLNSGFRIVRKDQVVRSWKHLPDGFSFTTTLTLSMLANGGEVDYVPIDYNARTGRSKIRPIHDTMNFLQLIVRTVMFFNPLKIFLPLSLFFLLSSVIVLVVSSLFGRVMDITTVLLFVTGLNLLAIGLLADLIDKRLGR